MSYINHDCSSDCKLSLQYVVQFNHEIREFTKMFYIIIN